MPKSRYMSAQEVAAELGISVATVYAYVSRGLIRSEAAGGKTRARRYHREDVERLKQRQAQRRDPEQAASTALDWGAALLESELTLIADGHLYYRGKDACQLAQTATIEQVAALLWTGDLETDLFEGTGDAASSSKLHRIAEQFGDYPPFERFQALLPIAALDDLAAYDLRPLSVVQTGVRILNLLTTIAADQPVRASISNTLAQTWTRDDQNATRLLNMALILCADHELNVSSFTARCVASAGSTPYSAVIAGLAALQGAKHGGSTERVMAMVQEISSNVRAGLASRIKRGESLPGFRHPLYPDGDPRGRLLLDSLTAAYPDSETVQTAHAIIDEAASLIGEHPNIDFALVTLALALNLPEGAPIALFALGRTVGWIAHALEQYSIDRLIRPRAKYVGRMPENV